MPFMELNQASSMNSGADLWIVPQLPVSKSAQRMDWYLNFLLTKSSLHAKVQAPAPLSSLIKMTGLEETNWAAEASPRLLIPSDHHLPNRWLVQVTFFQENLENWCRNISACWKDLGHPTLRIFLPTGLSSTQFHQAWKSQNPFDDFTVVCE